MLACLRLVFIEKQEEDEGRREGGMGGGGKRSQILAEHLNIISHKSFVTHSTNEKHNVEKYFSHPPASHRSAPSAPDWGHMPPVACDIA